MNIIERKKIEDNPLNFNITIGELSEMFKLSYRLNTIYPFDKNINKMYKSYLTVLNQLASNEELLEYIEIIVKEAKDEINQKEC